MVNVKRNTKKGYWNSVFLDLGRAELKFEKGNRIVWWKCWMKCGNAELRIITFPGVAIKNVSWLSGHARWNWAGCLRRQSVGSNPGPAYRHWGTKTFSVGGKRGQTNSWGGDLVFRTIRLILKRTAKMKLKHQVRKPQRFWTFRISHSLSGPFPNMLASL